MVQIKSQLRTVSLFCTSNNEGDEYRLCLTKFLDFINLGRAASIMKHIIAS